MLRIFPDTAIDNLDAMKKQITHISLHRTGKIIALTSAAATALCFTALLLVLAVSYPERFSHIGAIWLRLTSITLSIPLVSGFFSYLFTLFWCFLYNRIAKRTGGIEFTVAESRDS
jgi:hypothetical protein